MDTVVRDTKIGRLVGEIDALIEADETSDRKVTGGWQTFDDIVAAAHVHTWDAYSLDLSADAASFRALDARRQEAVRRVFGTIYRAESVVDDWMAKIVAAVPREPGYESMRAALMTQEHDERMHRGSLLRVADEVLGIPPEDADRFARRYNNFVAEILFDAFERLMRDFLRPGRTLADLHAAIFVYGVISEDVVANSDVVIRRAKGKGLYDTFHLPAMKEGQTNVRRDEGRHVRIAVLATKRFLAEQGEAAAELLLDLAVYYMDMADRLVRRAKASRGLIDLHLAESYGPDVDALYYYVMNMKRLAVRLNELGLRAGVLEVRKRVDAAIEELSDNGELVVETPSRWLRVVGPRVMRYAGTARLAGS
jgi:hypothetical protein